LATLARALLASTAVLAGAACARGGDGVERIAVAAVRQPATSLVFAAEAAGCLDRERLVMTGPVFDLGRDALALLRDGGADAAVVFHFPLIRAAFQDPRLRILTTLHTSTRNTRVVARRDRGIADAAHLRGKRIGVAHGTNADYFVQLMLRSQAIPASAATVVGLAPEQSVQALAGGSLDAAVLSDPPASQAERALGDRAVVLESGVYSEVSLLATREDVLRDRAPALRALLRALACAERRSAAGPDAALPLVRDRFPDQDEASLRAQLERVRWGLGLDHVLVDGLRAEGEWLTERRLEAGPPPDPKRLVAAGPLAEVEPEAVMLLPEE
jgi:NitT/TauT family transport system substrate-binding protein